MAELPKIVLRKLRRRSAGSDSTVTPGALEHPDANLLASFAEQKLTERERLPLMNHLAECAECREHVALAFPLPEAQTPGTQSTNSARGQSAWARWPAGLRWPALLLGRSGRWLALSVVLGTVLMVVLVRRPVSLRVKQRLISANKVASVSTAVPPGANHAEIAAADRSKLEANLGEQPARAYTVMPKTVPGSRLAGHRNLSTSKNPTALVPAPAAAFRAGNAGSEKKEVRQSFLDTQGRLTGGGRVHAGSAPRVLATPPPPAAVASSGVSQTSPREPGHQAETGVGRPPSGQKAAAQAPRSAPISTEAEAGPRDELRARESRSRSALEMAPGAELSALRANGSLPVNGKNAPPQFNARWSISRAGNVERSLDGGKTWEEVRVGDGSSAFRVLVADGPEVWAGGSRGALYHSADDGARWVRVSLTADHAGVTEAIISIDFADPKHVTVVTEAGERWTTQDGGEHWEKQSQNQ